MLYTIGHKPSYEQYFDENGTECFKLGIRYDDAYLGGIAFITQEEAQAYITTRLAPDRVDYAVYGILCDLDNTYQIQHEPFLRIKTDARLVRV